MRNPHGASQPLPGQAALSTLGLLRHIGVQTFALLTFTLGFFLTRHEVPHTSTCQDAALWELPRTNRGVCWSPARFKRAVIIVIDALRFDFVAPLSDEDVRQATRLHSPSYAYHLNKIPTVRRLLDQDASRALLYRFEADPPTTTMQRLKGLTTGSLPTFIDFRNNFQSPAITEDNLVHQLLHAGRRITAMGDDTWELLFPQAFNRSFPFPSFNTRDLDTVDDGVLEHLTPEMAKGDWDVLIAHFLGVDHVGHTFGPSHPAMEKKLQQMDAALTSVVDLLGDDTVLLVMGDHGMTEDGNHGGATAEETGAALFMYSKSSPLVSGAEGGGVLLWDDDDEAGGRLQAHTARGPAPRRVAQVDLVPTLSLLLGIPIPYANLGSVMPELMHAGAQGGWAGLARDLHANAYQVHRYLNHYAEVARLPEADLEQLRRAYSGAVEAHKAAIRTRGRQRGAEQLQQACGAYRRFLRDALALGRRVWAQYDLVLMGWGLVLLALSFACVLGVVVAGAEVEGPTPRAHSYVWAAGALGLALLLSLALPSLFLPGNRWMATASLLLAAWCLREAWGGLRASRVVHALRQAGADAWLGAGLVVLQGLSLFSNSFIEGEEKAYLFLSTTALLLLTTTATATQGPGATPSPLEQLAWLVPAALHRVASLHTGHGQDYAASFGTRSTALPLWGLLILYRVLGAGAGHLSAVGWGYAMLLIYWVAGAEPDGPLFASSAVRLWVPRASYALSLALAVEAIRRPGPGKEGWAQPLAVRRAMGLAAAASVGICMVLGPSSPLSLLCMAAEGVALCWAHARARFPAAVVVQFVGRSFYYMTGHHNQFSRLQYGAAFVGFDEFNVYMGGALLFVNTFGTELLSLLMLVCVCYAGGEGGEGRLRRELTVVMAMSAFRTLLTTVCVAIQRRHLMVWAIFAPKFVFDGVMHVVQGALCVLVALLCTDGGGRAGKDKAR